jgi:hypothetical protein
MSSRPLPHEIPAFVEATWQRMLYFLTVNVNDCARGAAVTGL